MKKILSVILSIVIATATLPIAYASGYAINNWNGFKGDGVTVANPDPAADSDDDVVKFVVGEAATLSLPESVYGNMLVSFDFYAESEQDSEINVLASDDTVMGTFALASDGTAGAEAYETGKWQTAKILVFPDGKIYRAYLNDVFVGEGTIDEASLACSKLGFTAGGVLYINNIDVSEYALPLWADSMLKTVYKNDSAVTVDAAHPLFTTVSVENAIIEAKIDATAIDGGSLSLTLGADNGEGVKVLNISGTEIPEGEFTVKVNVSTDSQTADVYVGETKVSEFPVSLLSADKTPATEIGEITLEVTGEGSVSVKSLYVKEQSEIKNPAGESTKILYEENFNNATVGSPVPYFEELGAFTKMGVSFTTVDATTGHSTSNVGMLKQKHYYSGNTLYRFNDDGTADTEAQGFASGIADTWYRYDLSEKAEGIDNITLKFKYYNAMNANSSADNKGVIRERLFAGFGTGDATNGTGQLSPTSKTSVSYYLNPGNQYAYFLVNGSSSNGVKGTKIASNIGRKWLDAEINIEENADGTATVTMKGQDKDGNMQTETGTIAEFPVIRNLSFEIQREYGGKFYIDDIEVSTIVTRDEDEYYTEAELMDISSAVTDSVYTNDITRVAVDVEEPDMPDGTFSETIENNKTTYYSNDFSTMGVYGFEESENLEAAAVYADNMGSVMSLTQKEAGSPAKAVYKIGSITDTWDGTVDTSWYDASAEGYEIWSGADLAGLRKLVNDTKVDFTGKTVKLMANIDLDNKNWTPIGTGIDSNGFKGTFDGNGHEIRNLNVRETVKDSESNTRYFGLFGRAEGRIANLGINGAKVIITSYTIKPMHLAALASYFQGTMESCYVIGAEVKEVRPEDVEKQIKWIKDGGTWAYNRDHVAVLVANLAASSTVNGCYTRDVNIYASWHSISSPFVGMSNGSSGKLNYIKNSYAAAPFTYTTNPATGERGRVYTMTAKSTNSNTIGINNYITHTVEDYRSKPGTPTADIFGNGFSTLDTQSGEIATVSAGALGESLKSANLYADDIANVNAGHPILKSQRLAVDADEMNIAFEAMVPTGSDADLVLYSGNEVAKTISLTDLADNEWKTIDLAFRNGTYIPTINGVPGEAVEFESANDGVSEFAFVVNNGTAYIENLMIYKDSAELLKKKINKIMADIYEQVPEYPVLNESLTLPETVDGYLVTWKSSNKSYVTDKGEILARKDCTMPISLTATITLDPANADYAPADANVTFNFMLAPADITDDEKIVDGIIADIINGTYLTEEKHEAITKDLNTLPTEWDGATITWEATGDAMDDEGKITIPETDNADVTLSATIVLGDVEKTETLNFTVLSYENILKNASDAITYELINGADGNMVKKNLNFPKTGLYGTEIEWSSNRTDLITDRGFLMEINDEEYVTITVTVAKDGRSTTKDIPFVTYISPTVKLAADMAEVTVPEETSENMELDTVGDIYGSTITWASNSTYAQVNGARINITRPEYVVGDTTVTLTATFEIDGVTVSKDYDVLIKCLPSNETLIQAELDKIDFSDISDESEAAVQGNLHLVYDFPYGITPTWTSDAHEEGIVTNDGIVTRPAIGEPDKAVTMTLKLERGGVELSKDIPFTVKAYGTTQEILDYAKAQLNFRVLSDDPINLVVDDLFLPKAWKFGTEISWTSDSNLIKVEEGTGGNYKGTVTLAEFGTTNTPVKLTATITYDGQTVTKDFYVTVGEHHGYEPLINTDFEMLTRGVNYAADRNNLGGGQYEHNNLYQVTVPEADPVNGENTALKIYKTSDMPHIDGGNSWAFFRTVAAQRRAGIIRIEQDIYLESMPNLTYRIVGSVGGGKDGNYEEINVNINKDGEIYQWKSDYTASKKIEFGKWNTLAIEFSTYEKWIDIYLNGDLVLDNAPFQWNKDGTNISALKIKFNPGADKVTTANDTHTLYIDDLKVLRKVDYSGEMAAAAKDLEVGFLAAQNINEITSNVVIPDLSKYELEVSGTSSNTNVVANDGTVTRPASDTEVEYTVKLSSEFGGVRERTFKLLVKGSDFTPGVSGGTVTDAEKVLSDINSAITELKNNHTLNYVTGNLTLPTTAPKGSTITWKSLNTSVVSNSGAVTRPSADTTVTIIATATLNGISERKEVQITVKAGTQSGPVIIPGAGAGTTGSNSGGGLSGVMPYEPPKTTETQTPSEIPTTSVGFVDITNHWAKDYITELYNAGVINGVSETEFAPNDSISREAFLTMLIRALGNELDADYGEVFDDVKPDDWYYQYVMEGYKMGIVNGTSMTEFGTGANISRQDLCTMIARALESEGIEMDAETASEFADNILIEIYAKDAVYGLQNLGIINGKDNNYFDPTGVATRAEAAKIMAGLMAVLAEAE
ncbi:MAG: S-layer homology domain-containing protein [Clostridia bacterium]|nr:S-layer homology domain-containing protein [Clostridia bacterium]